MFNDDCKEAASLGQRVVELDRAGEGQACVSLCDEIVARFSARDNDTRIRREVARALRNKAIGLRKLDRHHQSIETCEDLARTFASDEDEGIRETAATGAALAVTIAKELDDSTLALGLCAKYIPLFTNGHHAPVPEQAVLLVGIQAGILVECDRFSEALTAVNQFLALAAAHPSAAVTEQLENARGLQESLSEHAGWVAQLGKPYEKEHASAKGGLLSSLESWLCMPDGPGPADAEIAFMRSCAAMYDQLRGANPEMANDRGALAMLQEIATETLRTRTGSRMAAAREWNLSGLSDGVAEAVAAARLAAAGESRVVNITASIMSQGLDCEWPWTRKPGTAGHLWLLPAISSALSPDKEFAADALGRDVPPCFYSDGMEVRVWPEVLFRALSPSISDEARSAFFNWAVNEKADLYYTENEPDHQFMLSDWDTVVGEIGPDVAAALGLDPDSVDFANGCVMNERLSRLRGIDPPSAEPAEMDDQAAVEFAHLVYWAASESHLLIEAGGNMAQVARDHPWVIDWYPSTMPWAVWPPDRDVLREALRAARPPAPTESDEPDNAEQLDQDAETRWRAAQATWTVEGSFNVESGNATVNVSVSHPSCGCFDEGPDGHTQLDCEICRRPAKSRYSVGSGAGDGVYPVYRLMEESDRRVHGVIAVFDEQQAMQLESHRRGPWDLVRQSDPVYLGAIRSHGSLTFCEAYHGTDRDNAVVEVVLPEGTLHVVAWMGDVTAYGVSWGYRTQALAVYDEPTMRLLEALATLSRPSFEADE